LGINWLNDILSVKCFKHAAIAEFPSRHFYDDKLETGSDEQVQLSSLRFWPGGPAHPIAFVHHVGSEATLPVATDEGSEQSKSNPEEVILLVR